MRKKQAKFTRQMTIGEFEALFPTDDACKQYLTDRRWPEGVTCPRCGSDKVYALTTRAFHWECPACRQGGAYRFSVLVGTCFEDTKVGLRDWFRVIHMMLTAKKGVAALEIQRVMGFGSYKTAHYMCHRIRLGFIDPEFRKLMGIVEVDETYIGGRSKNKHKGQRQGRRGTDGKLIVAGAVARGGTLIARVIHGTDAKTMQGFVREAVSTKVDLLATDEHPSYQGLSDFPHDIVRHSAGQYVTGAVHTQTIDSFWSLIKRGIMGTYHKVSAKYLPLYVAEFEWRYNNRKNADIFGSAIARC